MSDRERITEQVTREVHPREARPRAVGEPSAFALWTGVLLAPLAVLGNIEAGYSLGPLVCESWPKSIMHIVVAAMLMLVVASGLQAWRNWTSSGREWPGDRGNPVDRSRFLAALGVMCSALCALLVLSHWLAVATLHPCQ